MKNSLFLFLMLSILTFSCKNQDDEKIKNDSLIASFTSVKELEPEDVIYISFKKPVELFAALSENEKNKVITLSPEVSGKVYQKDDKTLVFKPDWGFPFKTNLKVTVHLDKLFRKPPEHDFTFDVKTKPLFYSFEFTGIDFPKNNDTSNIKVTGILKTSAKVKTDKLKQVITVKQNDKTLPFTISQEADNNYVITINNVKKSKEDSEITINIKGSALGAESDMRKSYMIPSSIYFTLLQYKIIKEPEKYVKLVFSDVLDDSQQIKGLVYFKSGIKSKISVKNNVIKIFPQQDVKGKEILIINKAIKKRGGKHLVKDYTLTLYFEQEPPAVRFAGKGNILVGNDDWQIPFEAVNLKALDVVVFKIYANNIGQFMQMGELDGFSWEMNKVGEYIKHQKIILDTISSEPDNLWKSYSLDLSKMIKSEQGAIYRIFLKFRKDYAKLSCRQHEEEDKTDNFDSTSYFYDNYYYPENYQWSERNNFCSESYYNYDVFKEKNFLATSIGLIVKNNGENRYKVFTRNLMSADPLKNVEVIFYSYQHQQLGKTVTDDKGEGEISLDKEPFLAVAKKENKYGYLKLKRGNALSYSKFDIGGMRSENGLKGYIFGERGVWRPGDTLFLTFLLDDQQKILPRQHPVTLKVFDALDKVVYSKVSTNGQDGFYLFKVPTEEDAPTGFWKAVVSIGNLKFTKSLHVENILPNRLKINLKTTSDKLYRGKNIIRMEAKWLHGGVASNLKAEVTEIISAAKTKFANYEHYEFDDPARTFYPEEKVVFNGKLDENGKAAFQIYQPEKKYLPSTLNLNFVARVYEAGGRFSIEEKSLTYYPYSVYIGIKPPVNKEENYLETDKNQKFSVVTLDEKGNKISVKGLVYEVYKLGWSWWYHSEDNNLAYYISRNSESKVASGKLSTKNGYGSFVYKVTYPDWGRYYIKIIDSKTGSGTGTIVYFDWPDIYNRNNRPRDDAALLSLTLDKNNYEVGNNVMLSFPSSAGAKALVSVEKNNKIIRSWWVETTAKQTTVKFEITADMAPNVYTFVSVVQPYDQTINDLPIRSYGVLPVYVTNKQAELKPLITVPEEIRPETFYNIKVSEQNKREMTYVVAVVDEGLLNLTAFKTPSPHSYFYGKEALAVNTWDYYDYVMAAYGKRINKIFAVGGSDEGAVNLKKKKLSRFKPVVRFLGPFHLEKGSPGKTHKVKMDNYMGSVRVMVIAANGQGAYGSNATSVKVKKPLMVLASLPRRLVPEEVIKVPVTIFVMDDKFKNPELKISSDEFFEVEKPTRKLMFDNTGEHIVMVKIKVKKKTGTGKISFKVTAKGETAKYETGAEIRNPGKRIYKTEKYFLKPSKSITVNPNFPDESYNKQLLFSAYTIKPINLKKRLDYLIRYPYGCAEQVVSSVFPQLFIDDFEELDEKRKEKISKNIQKAINKLQNYQTYEGGFAYWPDSYSGADEWVTSYAGQFLLLAGESGYFVPRQMMKKWTRYQKRKASLWVNNRGVNDLVQAYRLYTLALAQQPNRSAMNRMKENSKLSYHAKLRLAAAYAVAGRKDAAENIMEETITESGRGNVPDESSYGSVIRDEALALETFLLLGKENKAAELYQNIANVLGSNNWLSTQTTAFALYASALFVENKPPETKLDFEYVTGNVSQKVVTEKPVFTKELPPENPVKIYNKSNGNEYFSLTTSWIGAPGTFYNEESAIKLQVDYFDMAGNNLDVYELEQGYDFYARVKVKNIGFRYIKHLALSFPVPSGWELLNTRLFDIGKSLHSSKSNYQDFKDDRMDVFFNLDRKEIKTFYILFNAAYPGDYFIFPVTCSAMYDNTVNAARGGGKVTVK